MTNPIHRLYILTIAGEATGPLLLGTIIQVRVSVALKIRLDCPAEIADFPFTLTPRCNVNFPQNME